MAVLLFMVSYVFTVPRCMENADTTARSSQRLNDMKDVSSRLQEELREISKEEERQKLLDALSESQTKNAELEKALAELAREQDRIALFERERVLKRAQVAQATAALVYEANWARNRMESEMRQAKLRAMVFNDPLPPPTQPGLATISEIISAPSVAPPISKSGMKESAGDSRRSSNTQSVGSAVKTTVETPVGLPPTVDVRRNPPPAVMATTPAVPLVHQDESFSLSPTIPDEPGITDLVSSAAANVFGTLLSSYNEYTATAAVAPTNSNMPVPDSVVNPANQITNTSNEKQRPVVKSRIASTPPLPDQRTTRSSVKFGPKVSSYLPPRSPEDTSLKVRAIRNSSKGEWTNPQLLTEAEVTMTMLMQERDEVFWTNKLLLEKIFGLPDGTHMPPVNPKSEWIELEEFWIQKAAKLGPSDTAKKQGKISIDSLIAEKAGVDSKVLTTDGGDVGAEKNEVEKPSEPVPVAQPAELGGPKKKKNGCVIM